MNSGDDTPTLHADQAESAQAKKDRSRLSDAVLPLVGVLLGGLLAASTSLFTAHLEAKAQERQAIEQYRRDNREKIYAEMLAQVAVMQNVMNQVELQTAIASARKPLDQAATAEQGSEIYNRLTGQFQPAFDKLSTAISDAELVGSHRVIELSKALQDSYFVSFNKLVVPSDVAVKLGSGYKGLQPAKPNPAAQTEDDANLDQQSPAILKEMLVAAAKEDLAFND